MYSIRDMIRYSEKLAKKGQVIIEIKVFPNSGKNSLDYQKEKDSLLAFLKSNPEKNKANLELTKLLSQTFSVPLKNVKIIKGAKSQNKVIKLWS